MESSLKSYFVGMKDLDVAERAETEKLVMRVTTIPSYDILNDGYKVFTSLTPEEFHALPWPDGCTLIDL